MSTVFQVGDIANVAEDLTAALHAHTNWRSTPVAVAELRRRSRLARIADLPRRAFRTRRAVAEAVAAKRPDIVHLHWARYAPFIDTGGVPLIVHVHGTDVRGRGASVTGRLVRRAMQRADAVIVSTPDLLTDTPSGARWLPNPVDLDAFSPGEPTDPMVGGERPVVLLFAKLNPVKGADRLVAIAAAIRELDPAVRVVALGGGELDGAAIAAGVDVLPPRPRSELTSLLRSVDVVVGQQRLGILSLSELEAMACERPTVLPLRDGLYPAEVPVVSVSDPHQVARECLALVASPERRRALGTAGRRYVGEHHSPSAVASTLVDIYESVR